MSQANPPPTEIRRTEDPDGAADADDVTLGAFVTVTEAAKVLRMDRKGVYAGFTRGEIPGLRIGRSVRIHLPSLLRMLARGMP